MTDDPCGILNDCGCCEGAEVRTPADIHNRPGLDAIAYRVGTYATFKEGMLARLSDARWPALGALRTRDDSDFSIGLIDAWATAADVLTFYQERIANESYLRTAAERRSLQELGRLIGYKPRPGVAASTVVAFMLEEAPGAPDQAIRRATIDVGTKIQSIPGPNEKPQIFETVEKVDARIEWNAIGPREGRPPSVIHSTTQLYVQGTTSNLKAGDMLLLLLLPDRTTARLRRVKGVDLEIARNRTAITLEHQVSLAGSVEVIALGDKLSIFGHNAPYYPALVSNPTAPSGAYPHAWDDPVAGPIWSIWHDSLNATLYNNADIFLDRSVSSLKVDDYLVLSAPERTRFYKVQEVTEQSLTGFALSAAITGMFLKGLDDVDLVDEDKDINLKVRTTVVYAGSRKLASADAPLQTPVTGNEITLDGSYPSLERASRIALFGTTTAGAKAVEIAEIADASDDEGFTTLVLRNGLSHDYLRQDLIINANVGAATHGETVREVLGSGDATKAYQHFKLRQPPLTYVSAATPGGAQSTLKVYVNDVLWREVPFLYARGSSERVYVTQSDDEGRTVVRFGDGVNGARLPTGQHNIRAEYRRGTGLGGLVKQGQLSQLLSRPLGLKSAINPVDAGGAEDPETRDEARRNAPLTVLTFDRAVSLKDFEDLARTFAGIAKAQAVWIWNGRRRSVFITVAGPNAAVLDEQSPVIANLKGALRKAGDPSATFEVRSYRQVTFQLHANFRVHPEYRSEQVLAAVVEELRRAFSFQAREFGQPVAQSEVIAVIHRVSGVLAVDLDRLSRNDHPLPPVRPWLLAEQPAMGTDGVIEPAELLVLDEASFRHLAVVP